RIDGHWWIDITESDQARYREMYRKTRISLRDKGVYDDKMLTVMSLVRCKKDPNRAECTAADKE
ncbi:MAG: hypothetical protein KAQ91_04985, partial [Methylococcales bacterium]|nr:hypothetical protein [Methylococcales bacterium]